MSREIDICTPCHHRLHCEWILPQRIHELWHGYTFLSVLSQKTEVWIFCKLILTTMTSQHWTVTLYALAVKKSPAVSEMKRCVLPINLCPYTCFRVIWWDTGCFGLSVCLSVCSQFLLKRYLWTSYKWCHYDMAMGPLHLDKKVRVTGPKVTTVTMSLHWRCSDFNSF